MVQRTVGWVVGGVAAALLTAGAARAEGAGKATVVLRDGRTIEAAQVEFRERTFVVRTTDGKEERLDERDVLRVELASAPVPGRRPASHLPLKDVRCVVEGEPGDEVVTIGYRSGTCEGVDVTLTVERRERPDGAWKGVSSVRPGEEKGGESHAFVDTEASWPHRYDYRLTTTAVVQAGFAPLPDAELRRVVTVEDVEGPRRVWVSPAAIGSEVVVDVRNRKTRAQLRPAVGEPLAVDGVPVGARVVSLGREADGTSSIRVAWDGVAEPEVVRADAAFGDPERPLVFVGPAPVGAARPAPRVAIDLRQASVAATARTLGVEAGGAFALVQVDPARRVDLRLRSSSFDQAAALVAELLDRALVPHAGVTAISAPEALAERLAPATSPLVRRLDEERVTLLVSAPRAFDLAAAVDLFAAATGIDVVLSTGAREAASTARAGFVHAPSVTLAQALTLLTGAAGMTWTTRGEVVLVKTHKELQLDEVWLDLRTHEGATLEALAPTLRTVGVELWTNGDSLAVYGQPARAGRVALPALLEGLEVEWRGADQGAQQWVEVRRPRPLPGVADVHVRADGQVEARRGSSSQQGLTIADLAGQRGAVRLWAADPGPALEFLRAGQATVLAVNGRPPAPPVTGSCYAPSDQVPPAEQVPGLPWLRRVAGVSYAQPTRVPEVFYARYQALDAVTALLLECEGELTTTARGERAFHLTRVDEHSDLHTRLGLQGGDAVLSVNGRPLGATAAACEELHAALRDERRFAFLVEREGRLLVLSFHVE